MKTSAEGPPARQPRAPADLGYSCWGGKKGLATRAVWVVYVWVCVCVHGRGGATRTSSQDACDALHRVDHQRTARPSHRRRPDLLVVEQGNHPDASLVGQRSIGGGGHQCFGRAEYVDQVVQAAAADKLIERTRDGTRLRVAELQRARQQKRQQGSTSSRQQQVPQQQVPG